MDIALNQPDECSLHQGAWLFDGKVARAPVHPWGVLVVELGERVVRCLDEEDAPAFAKSFVLGRLQRRAFPAHRACACAVLKALGGKWT